jgi:hypothetical protein
MDCRAAAVVSSVADEERGGGGGDRLRLPLAGWKRSNAAAIDCIHLPLFSIDFGWMRSNTECPYTFLDTHRQKRFQLWLCTAAGRELARIAHNCGR